jgi:glycosyltransferase involved in cell wall biosynthesis
MVLGQRVAVVLPAYEAAATLPAVLADLARQSCVDDVILVDDASPDATVAVARSLGLNPIVHPQNRGYGANQKT